MSQVFVLSLALLMFQEKPDGFFEGRIQYKVKTEFTGDFDPDTIELIKKTRGTRISRFWKSDGRTFVHCIDANFIEMFWYDPQKNMDYVKFKGENRIEYGFGDEPYTKPVIVKKSSDLKILGYDTVLIEVLLDGDMTRYWMAPSLPIDVTKYEQYTIADWNKVLELGKGVMLKKEVESDGYVCTETAVSVKLGTIAEKMFKLPDLPLVKAKPLLTND